MWRRGSHTDELVAPKPTLIISTVPFPTLPLDYASSCSPLLRDFIHLSQSGQKHQYLSSFLPASPSYRQFSHPINSTCPFPRHCPIQTTANLNMKLLSLLLSLGLLISLLSCSSWLISSTILILFLPSWTSPHPFHVCRNNALSWLSRHWWIRLQPPSPASSLPTLSL